MDEREWAGVRVRRVGVCARDRGRGRSCLSHLSLSLSLLQGLYMGVGLGLGGLVGGYVHAALGARAVFAVAAAVVAAAWAVISLAELALSGRRAAAWETVEAERVNGTVVASGGA